MLLGILARDGNGVPKDSKAAYYHFRVACLQGGDEAEEAPCNRPAAPFGQAGFRSRPRPSDPKLSNGFHSTILCLRSSIEKERFRMGSPGLPWQTLETVSTRRNC